MASEFRCERRVQFHETDMGGIVHFATFFPWMEETEHAFFRSLGLSVVQEHEGHTYTWPRVAASCEYLRPLRFEEVVAQHLRVIDVGRKSITYGITFSRNGEPCARGRVTAVCCVYSPGKALSSVEIPMLFHEKIEACSPAEGPSPEPAK